MRIGVVGINHKLAPVDLRERVAAAFQRHFCLENPLKSFSEESPFILLSTCNRSELYFSAPDLAYAHQAILALLKKELSDDFEQKLYTFFGLDCFLHLAKVTAGLDSAIIAETEIQGQVKGAYETACGLRSLCSELHFLFQKSLKIGKEVRSRYQIEKSLPDLEHALFFHATDFLKKSTFRTLFVGASEINLKIAHFFMQKGQLITFCNRTPISSLPFNAIGWHELQNAWKEFELVVCATKSPHYLLHPCEQAPQQQLLVDLSVPRNIDPMLAQGRRHLLNIDHLQLFLQSRRSLVESQLRHIQQHLFSQVIGHIASFQMSRQRALPLALVS